MLTHGNLCANVAQTVDAIGSEIRPDDVGLLFLPLAHSLTKGNLLFSLGLNGYWQYVVIGLILVAALGIPYLITRARVNARPTVGRAA